MECSWCNNALKSNSETVFKDQTTFVGNCGNCGTYIILPDLYEILDSIPQEKKNAVKKYLNDLHELGIEENELNRHFVMNQLGEIKD